MTRRIGLITLIAALGLLGGTTPAALAAGVTVNAVTTTEGTALPANTTIATFSDGRDLVVGGCPAASLYTATITWGDGSGPSTATVTGPVNPVVLSPCEYTITAGHLYTEAGSDTVDVAVSGGGGPFSGTGTATVEDAPLTPGSPLMQSGQVGGPLVGAVANFSDGNTFASPSDFSATITWGDGTTSTGTVVAGSTTGTFAIDGSHTYAHEGTYSTSVTVTDITGGNSVTVPGTAQIGAALTAESAETVTATAATAFSGSIGMFTDSDTTAPTSDFTATIDWGDGGAKSSGTVTSTSTPGEFAISGSHTYATSGSFAISIEIDDPFAPSLALTAAADVVPQPTEPPTGPTGTTWMSGATGTTGTSGATGTTGTSGATGTTGTSGATGPSGRTLPFSLTLGRAALIDQRMLAVPIGCPKSEQTCRGYLLAARADGQRTLTLASTLFILPGGTHGTLDLAFSASARRTLTRLHRTKLHLIAYATDPARDRSGSGTGYVFVTFRR